MRNMILTGFLIVMLAPSSPAQGPEVKVAPRFGVPGNARLFPQSNPKETLESAIKAIDNGRYEYLIAHVLDAKTIDARIAERSKQLMDVAERDVQAIKAKQKASSAPIPPEERIPEEAQAL
ncbi:MAG: hypothetical protein ACRCZF_19240, partial [Gemmataceae bacterium]